MAVKALRVVRSNLPNVPGGYSGEEVARHPRPPCTYWPADGLGIPILVQEELGWDEKFLEFAFLKGYYCPALLLH
jgi:hypothetical protein